jgi:hypothetical protein
METMVTMVTMVTDVNVRTIRRKPTVVKVIKTTMESKVIEGTKATIIISNNSN